MKSLLRLNPEQMITLALSFSLCLRCALEASLTVLLVMSWQGLSPTVNGELGTSLVDEHQENLYSRLRCISALGLFLTQCHCLLRGTAHKESCVLTEK